MVISLYLLRMSCVSDQRVGFLQSPTHRCLRGEPCKPKTINTTLQLRFTKMCQGIKLCGACATQTGAQPSHLFPPQDVRTAMVGIVLKQLVQQQFGQVTSRRAAPIALAIGGVPR